MTVPPRNTHLIQMRFWQSLSSAGAWLFSVLGRCTGIAPCQIIFSSSYKLSTLFVGKYTLLLDLWMSDSPCRRETENHCCSCCKNKIIEKKKKKGFLKLCKPKSKSCKKRRGNPYSSLVKIKKKPNTCVNPTTGKVPQIELLKTTNKMLVSPPLWNPEIY